MSPVRAALVLGALLSTAQLAEAGPISPLGHEYEIVFAEGISWPNARAAAQGLGTGWDLATIGDAVENQFVESHLSLTLSGRSHFWIGATDSVTENTWVWVDATPFVFQDWWVGEPNNVGDEDFLAYDLRDTLLGPSWAWNDASQASAANSVRGYIAERDVSAVPEPGSLLLLGTGVAGLIAKARKRKKLGLA